jgi:dihydroorotate dehydrogenase
MLYSLARPILFCAEPETAHHLAFAALDVQAKLGLARTWAGIVPKKPVTVMGIEFPNPIGLAAGLDKNAEHMDGLAQLGFGFIEVGTLTPLPQPGNPQPRMFRIVEHEALINRLGFNNKGVEDALPRLKNRTIKIPVGVNIGKNAATPIENATDDYLKALRAVYEVADYITINISSPNTKNLRDLQAVAAVSKLVETIVEERGRLSKLGVKKKSPIAVKIAPDIPDDDVVDTVRAICDAGADAIISSNTTLSRDGVIGHKHASEAGGLSGAPLTERADRMLEKVVKAAKTVPVIGVGGIMSVADAQRKLDMGAALVQIYTGMLYRGPSFVGELVRGIRMKTR